MRRLLIIVLCFGAILALSVPWLGWATSGAESWVSWQRHFAAAAIPVLCVWFAAVGYFETSGRRTTQRRG